jgi:hypothetical protein|tara:strand:- start:3802 stop:3999 length:198 start_codon:yes stop_codon:yes gene_type:complete
MEPNDYTFTEFLTDRLNNEITRITDIIIDGDIKDLSEYNRLKGKIEGLRIALREITDVMDKVIES